jgi:hypothetical protein
VAATWLLVLGLALLATPANASKVVQGQVIGCANWETFMPLKEALFKNEDRATELLELAIERGNCRELGPGTYIEIGRRDDFLCVAPQVWTYPYVTNTCLWVPRDAFEIEAGEKGDREPSDDEKAF